MFKGYDTINTEIQEVIEQATTTDDITSEEISEGEKPKIDVSTIPEYS